MTTQKRSLGLWMLTALVAGNMIGSGVFLLPSALAKYGSISILAWIITSLGAICLALVFAHLSHLRPKIGGPYAYCREAFGDFLGFQVAYNYWVALWVGNAAVIVALVGYLSFFWPSLHTNHLLGFVISVSILWFITGVNIIGVKQAGFIQVFTTILKLLPLLAIACVGIFSIHVHYLVADFNISHKTTAAALNSAAALTFWSFLGIESATIPAEDVINPTVNVPRATILGALVAAIIYIICTTAVMGIVPGNVLSKTAFPLADAARIIFGHYGGIIVALGAIIATWGTANGWILLQGQIPLAASKDDLFPKIFSKRRKNGSPYMGLIITSSLITLLLYMSFNQSLVDQFTLIILLATLASLLPYLYTSMAQILLCIKSKNEDPKQSICAPIIIAILAFIFIAWAIIGTGKTIVFDGTLLLLSSAPFYVLVRWSYNKRKD